MAVIYVARSRTLADWGSSVGISKHLFRVGVTPGTAKQAVAELNEQACAGSQDWRLLKADDAGDLAEDEVWQRLAVKARAVDPDYYPRIRGARGIFRVTTQEVENSMLVERAIARDESLHFKLKPSDYGAYLIKNARR